MYIIFSCQYLSTVSLEPFRNLLICFVAFAELQTDMQSDLDNLGGGGIPFRHRHDYIMRVLFPGSEMHERLTQAMHAYGIDQFGFSTACRCNLLRQLIIYLYFLTRWKQSLQQS